MPLVLSRFSFYRGLDRQVSGSKGLFETPGRLKKGHCAKCELINKPEKIIPLTPINKEFKSKAGTSLQATTFTYCYSCENCSTVCPVVENYENPQEVLGLLPHQIMRSLGLGIRDLALGSNMLWDCVTCYQCQEHCPQGVKVTDILYELKNMAIKETYAL